MLHLQMFGGDCGRKCLCCMLPKQVQRYVMFTMTVGLQLCRHMKQAGSGLSSSNKSSLKLLQE